MPRTCVSGTFCFCASVADSVTLSTGFVMWLLNHVRRHDAFFTGATLMPTSPPTRRSGARFSFGRVVTAPTENCRYNSVSVGARKPELTAPQTLTWLDAWNSAAACG